MAICALVSVLCNGLILVNLEKFVVTGITKHNSRDDYVIQIENSFLLRITLLYVYNLRIICNIPHDFRENIKDLS